MSRTQVLMAAVLAVATSGVGRAGPLPVQWSYRVSVQGDPYVSQSGTHVSGDSFVPAYTPPSGQVSAIFTTTNGQWISVTGDRALTVATLQIRGATSRDELPTFFGSFGSAFPGGYKVTLAIRDDATGEVGELGFRGTLRGGFHFGENGQPVSDISNSFDPARQSLVLGGRTYTLDVGPFPAPGTPDIRDGSQPLTDAGMPSELHASMGVSATPEPGTILLAGLGTGLVTCYRWGRRRVRFSLLRPVRDSDEKLD